MTSPEKCPKCGALKGRDWETRHWYACGSHWLIDNLTGEITDIFYQEAECKDRQIAQLQERLDAWQTAGAEKTYEELMDYKIDIEPCPSCESLQQANRELREVVGEAKDLLITCTDSTVNNLPGVQSRITALLSKIDRVVGEE